MDATLTADSVRGLTRSIAAGARPDDPAELVDLLGALEELKSAACAVQAETAVDYDAARRRAESEQGVPARRQGRGVAGEVALARRGVAAPGPGAAGAGHDAVRGDAAHPGPAQGRHAQRVPRPAAGP
ncbi:hypothetical protein [Nocardioides sp. TF02-7]|uniref:hypothetical protein n=1 Tax=Nocardioides sp. TF02-7 TaxID=2917724 RepID=UPI001F054B18|nr:hypothetical protein [Nocardioides sp. TF02-7]UMG92562.1 hypothetical protein MF408_22605 [Nocardioides sp. TF02-7]